MCNYAESVGVFYCDPKEFAEKKDRFLNRLPVSLKQFDAFLRDQTFLAGEEPTVPDFHFCEVLSEIVMMEPHCLQGFSRLQVRALPCLTRRSHLSSLHSLAIRPTSLASVRCPPSRPTGRPIVSATLPSTTKWLLGVRTQPRPPTDAKKSCGEQKTRNVSETSSQVF